MKKLILIISFGLVALSGCKESYDPDFFIPETGHLVVEGYISSGNTATTITLSRTTKLKDDTYFKTEPGARVFVESDKNEQFQLLPIGSGVYSIASLNLDPSNKYRINISTANGKNYVSEFTAVKSTPPIDSISWKKENDGLQIYVHTHDDNSGSRFYQWKYDETWEIRSVYISNLTYYAPKANEVAVTYKYQDRSFDLSTYRCWQYSRLRNIQISSTEMLTKDVVYHPLAFIGSGSIKLGVLYSIDIKQYALSAEAYRFYLQMKKNNEQLGSIFDPQPSESRGNIVCTNDPSEVVVGHIDVTQEQSKRFFISPDIIGGWNYRQGCGQIVVDNISDSIKMNAPGMRPVIPDKIDEKTDSITTFMAAPAACVDCTLSGSNAKPAYWPN